MITAQEILVGHSSYPTEAIGENTRRYRQLGLGYTNLGALLMATGTPYDSDAGRNTAAGITALMTGEAYRTSARIASRMGAYAGFENDRESMLGVLEMHRDAAAELGTSRLAPDLLAAVREVWNDAVDQAGRTGVRNAQATVLAPTGTIGLLMDCDTTGIEPDFSLVKFKKLAGGGYFKIVNQSVPHALRNLGYTDVQITEIVS